MLTHENLSPQNFNPQNIGTTKLFTFTVMGRNMTRKLNERTKTPPLNYLTLTSCVLVNAITEHVIY